MEIINKKIEELKPYENNPRKNDSSVEYVKNSIKEFGFKVPIVITKDGEIVTGHTRYKACKELGIKEIPCVIADDLTDEQIKAFRIADNKVSEKSSWDLDLLKTEFEGLEDFDMTDFGFGDFEITMLENDIEPDEYDDELINKYSEHADEFLEKKRIIITYKGEDEERFLKDLLKQDELKVVYTAKEIIDNYEG